jgi:hypothetical protein
MSERGAKSRRGESERERERTSQGASDYEAESGQRA